MIIMVLNVLIYFFYFNGEWKESKLGQIIDIVFLYCYDVIGKVQVIIKEEVDEVVYVV